jgi:hypothetical protein
MKYFRPFLRKVDISLTIYKKKMKSLEHEDALKGVFIDILCVFSFRKIDVNSSYYPIRSWQARFSAWSHFKYFFVQVLLVYKQVIIKKLFFKISCLKISI